MGPTNAFCCSVNVDGVVNLCGGGGDTMTLHFAIGLVLPFYTEKWWGPSFHLPLHPLGQEVAKVGGHKGVRMQGHKGGRA